MNMVFQSTYSYDHEKKSILIQLSVQTLKYTYSILPLSNCPLSTQSDQSLRCALNG